MNNIRSTLCKGYSHGVTQVRSVRMNLVNEKEDQSESRIKSFEEVPGPKPIPILGNLWRYMPLIGEYNFKNLCKTYEKMHRQYGSLVKERILGNKVILHAFDSVDMFDIYKADGKYPTRSSHGILVKYRKERYSTYRNVGLFPSNGEEWYKFRNLFKSILLNSDISNSFSDVLENATEDLVERIHSITDYKFEVDILPELFKWSLECISLITLDRRLGCLLVDEHEDAKALIKATSENLKILSTTELFPFLQKFDNSMYRRFAAAHDSFASIIEHYIKDANVLHDKGELRKNCILSHILSQKKADHWETFTMIMDLFFAGIDTTAYTTGFALYNLAKNQSVQEKLRKELRNHLPEKTSRLPPGYVALLKYLTCVHKETLRLNPVAFANGRILQQDIILSGYKIPANTMVLLHHQLASLQEKHFKQANLFLPERWMEKSSPAQMLVSTSFGFGDRTCIGKFFATQETILAIAKLVRNFRIEYHYEDVGIETKLINVPDRPLKLKFIPLGC